VNLAELILTWECTREAEERMSFAEPQRASTAREDAVRAFRVNHTMVKIVLHFLLRVALQMSESRDQRGKALSEYCIMLFKAGLDLVHRRIETKVSISLFAIAKPLSAHYEKIKQMADLELAGIKRHYAEATTPTKSIPRSAWERRTDPGFMCCTLELLTLIVSADNSLIAAPFIQESGADLHCIIAPSLSCPERGVEEKLAKLIVALLAIQPLSSKVGFKWYFKIR